MAYVCLCHGITSREIRRQVRDGARTIEEIGVRCGAGTCCRGCHPTLEEMLEGAVRGASVSGAVPA